MTQDQIEEFCKEAYKEALLIHIMHCHENSNRGLSFGLSFDFIEREMEDGEYVNQIRIEIDVESDEVEFFTEKGSQGVYSISRDIAPSFVDRVHAQMKEMGRDHLIADNDIRTWYDTELAPILRMVIDAGKL